MLPTRASGIQSLGIRVRTESQLSFSQGLAKFEHQATACGQCVSLKSERLEGTVREESERGKSPAVSIKGLGAQGQPSRALLVGEQGMEGGVQIGPLCAKE